MPITSIRYLIHLQSGKKIDHKVEFDEKSMIGVNATPGNPPEWTRLDFNKCDNCPLDSKNDPHCPAALSMVNLINKCSEIDSFESTQVEVTTPTRKYIIAAPLQKAISSILGLTMATSSCPRTSCLRPMAHFHLPIASDDEDIFRASSMYLLAQYYRHKQGEEVDLELQGLADIYRHLQTVNHAMAKRLKEASNSNTGAKAILRLDLFSHIMAFNIKDSLDSMRHLFEPLLRLHDYD